MSPIYQSLADKKLFIVGFRDCLPFDTFKNLKDLGGNNIFLVELYQNTRKLFNKNLAEIDFEQLFNDLTSTGYNKTVSRNYAQLVLLKPHSIIPVSEDVNTKNFFHNIYILNKIIPLFVKEELNNIRESGYDFNHIVSLVGLPHVNPLKEELEELGGIKLEVLLFE